MEQTQIETEQQVNEYILGLLRDVTGLTSELKLKTTFEEINLQSLAITAFTSRLQSHFNNLSKTFIFDCKNALDVTDYLIKHHNEEIITLLTHQQQGNNTPVQKVTTEEYDNNEAEWPEFDFSLQQSKDDSNDFDIAIVGIDGKFPDADDLDTFWDNLASKKLSITEIPADRWPLDNFYEEKTNSRKSGKSYAKWGAFLDDVDAFDPFFFGISAKEAKTIDPQERLLLQSAWHAMDDAALFGERSKSLGEGKNLNVGVFVGVTTNTYSLLTSDNWSDGNVEIPASVPWSIANRVSFLFNFSGPSLAVDTACSSSLVALHLACESLKKGECKVITVKDTKI